MALVALSSNCQPRSTLAEKSERLIRIEDYWDYGLRYDVVLDHIPYRDPFSSCMRWPALTMSASMNRIYPFSPTIRNSSTSLMSSTSSVMFPNRHLYDSSNMLSARERCLINFLELLLRMRDPYIISYPAGAATYFSSTI